MSALALKESHRLPGTETSAAAASPAASPAAASPARAGPAEKMARNSIMQDFFIRAPS